MFPVVPIWSPFLSNQLKYKIKFCSNTLYTKNMGEKKVWFGFMVLNATFNNISVILWRGEKETQLIHCEVEVCISRLE